MSRYLSVLFLFLFCISSSLEAQDTDPKKAAIAALSRDEKNAMKQCPLHKKHMSLSDNFLSTATDEENTQNYPFAYQLHYRRHCPVCTKIMDKAAKSSANAAKKAGNKPTNEKCTVHNQPLYTNPEYNSVSAVKDKDRRKTAVNAKQYKGRVYCKTCSKVLDIYEKEKNK